MENQASPEHNMHKPMHAQNLALTKVCYSPILVLGKIHLFIQHEETQKKLTCLACKMPSTGINSIAVRGWELKYRMCVLEGVYHGRHFCVFVFRGRGGGGDMVVRKQFRSALFGSASVNIFLFLLATTPSSLSSTFTHVCPSSESHYTQPFSVSSPLVAVPFSIFPPLSLPGPSHAKPHSSVAESGVLRWTQFRLTDWLGTAVCCTQQGLGPFHSRFNV